MIGKLGWPPCIQCMHVRYGTLGGVCHTDFRIRGEEREKKLLAAREVITDVHLSTPNVADENGSLAREDVLYEDQLK